MHQRKGLIVGLANASSIAWGCAKVLRAAGAELALTYQNEKSKAYVQGLADELESSLFLPLDVRNEGELNALFQAISTQWGKLDFLIHAIAFAPKVDLHGRVVDCSREGFALAMDISCHSLMRLAKAAEPLMQDGGSIVTVSYYGAEKVVGNYNLMGPVKAALEASVRYLAAELGAANITVNALSPGPMPTRAASGLQDFDRLMAKARQQAPLQRLVTLDEVGELAAFLVSGKAQSITGQVIYIDGGHHIIA
ncbi:MAG: enoyl-ACP reductase FabI [Legionellaceae bacterium]|nr:enoyl-ACP reductase FabI [Legionellaceae bacterium]